jgi:enoyl-[acyl-carrier protein] reductase I
MATTTTVSNVSIAMSRPRITSSQKLGPAILGCRVKVGSCDKLGSVCHVASVKPFQQASISCASKFDKFVTKAMSESSSNKQVTGLPIDLRGFTSFFFLMVSIVKFDLT